MCVSATDDRWGGIPFDWLLPAFGTAGCPQPTRRSAVSQPPSGGSAPPEEPSEPDARPSSPGDATTGPQHAAPTPPGAYPPPTPPQSSGPSGPPGYPPPGYPPQGGQGQGGYPPPPSGPPPGYSPGGQPLSGPPPGYQPGPPQPQGGQQGGYPPPGPPPGYPQQGYGAPPGAPGAPGGPPPGYGPPQGYGPPGSGQPGYPPPPGTYPSPGGAAAPSFDLSKITIAGWGVLGAALLTLIASFFNFWSISVSGFTLQRASANGWSLWWWIPVLLAIAVGVIYALQVFGVLKPGQVRPEWLFYGAAASFILMIIVLIQTFFYDGGYGDEIAALGVSVSISKGPSLGVFFALVTTLALTYFTALVAQGAGSKLPFKVPGPA